MVDLLTAWWMRALAAAGFLVLAVVDFVTPHGLGTRIAAVFVLVVIVPLLTVQARKGYRQQRG